LLSRRSWRSCSAPEAAFTITAPVLVEARVETEALQPKSRPRLTDMLTAQPFAALTGTAGKP
jgi:hypothetical protein